MGTFGIIRIGQISSIDEEFYSLISLPTQPAVQQIMARIIVLVGCIGIIFIYMLPFEFRKKRFLWLPNQSNIAYKSGRGIHIIAVANGLAVDLAHSADRALPAPRCPPY